MWRIEDEERELVQNISLLTLNIVVKQKENKGNKKDARERYKK